MNIIDRKFAALVKEIKGLTEKELYYRIRRSFDQVPPATQKSCMNFFNQFGSITALRTIARKRRSTRF